MLEDFAAVALAFLDLYGLTFDTSWLRLSRAITDRTIELFYDAESDTWYDTASDHERAARQAARCHRQRNTVRHFTRGGAAAGVGGAR